MSYTYKVLPYSKVTPPPFNDADSARLYIDQEFLKLKAVLDSQAKAIQEIKDKLAAASVLPVT